MRSALHHHLGHMVSPGPHRADIERVGVGLAGEIAGPVRAEAIVQVGDGLTQLPGMRRPGVVLSYQKCCLLMLHVP